MHQATLLKPSVKITFDSTANALAVNTPYDRGFLAHFKNAIPYTQRRWNNDRRVWLVDVSCGKQLQDLIWKHYSVQVAIPKVNLGSQKTQTQLFSIRYLGATKERDDGTESAYGYANGDWNVVFSRKILQEWFGQVNRPDESPTLYSVLSVSLTASADEIKKSWRRLVRQWHPDVAKEPDAREQFERVQSAYEVLRDATTRAKYNAGLALERSLKQYEGRKARQDEQYSTYRAPLRCGLILVQGVNSLGRFQVEKILQWEDIVNARGQILVSTWGMGEDSFREEWVTA